VTDPPEGIAVGVGHDTDALGVIGLVIKAMSREKGSTRHWQFVVPSMSASVVEFMEKKVVIKEEHDRCNWDTLTAFVDQHLEYEISNRKAEVVCAGRRAK